jgi:hypothetical protein
MQAPDPIETVLARLMPPALSESGQRAIESMLDELAAEALANTGPTHGRSRVVRTVRFAVPLGIAAALAALVALVPHNEPIMTPLVMGQAAPEAGSGLILVGESDRIEAMSDEGWLVDPEGDAMQAVRVRVVEANTLRDEETGIVVQVSDPREEMILMPVTVF